MPTTKTKRSIGAEVRAYRESKGMTLAIAAERIGISFQLLSDFELGHRRLSLRSAQGIEAVFGAKFTADKILIRQIREKIEEDASQNGQKRSRC